MAGINYNYGVDKKTFGWVTNGALEYALLDENDQLISGFKSWGYITAVQLQFAVQKQPQFASVNGTRSQVDSFVSERTGTLNFTLTSAQAENLKTVLMGDMTTIAASVADESITFDVYPGDYNPVQTGKIFESFTSLTSVDGLITYEEDKNFVVNDDDVYVFSVEEQTARGATEIISDKTKVIVTGKFKETKIIEGFTKDSIKLAIRFVGRSVAKGVSTPFNVNIYKADFTPSTFDILSDQGYGQFQLTADVLANSNITGLNNSGNPYSQYFTYVAVR